MNTILRYTKKHQKIFLFISIILLCGFLLGIVLGITRNDLLKEYIFNYANNITGVSLSFLVSHFTIMAFLTITSFFVIGIPFFVGVFFIEGLILGLLLSAFFLAFHFSGLIFGLIFLFILYSFFLIGLFLLFPKCLEITRNQIGQVIYKVKKEEQTLFMLKGCLYIIFFLTLYDGFLYLASKQIFTFFHFLLK